MLPTDVVNQIARDRICERRTAADAWRLARFAKSAAENADRAPRWRLFRRRPAADGAAAAAAPLDAAAVAPILARVATKFAGDCGA
jgi:hypothetical protein